MDSSSLELLADAVRFCNIRADRAIAVHDVVIYDGVNFVQIDLPIGQDAVIHFHADDFAYDAGSVEFLFQLDHLTFERHGELVDDRGIDLCGFGHGKARPRQLVRHLVAGYDAHIIAGVKKLLGRTLDRKSVV